MLRSIVLIAFIGVLAAACGPKDLTRQERAVEEQMLRDRMTGWSRAVNNRDVDSLAGYYYQGPELTVAWMEGNRTRGWEEQETALREFYQRVGMMNLVVQDPVHEVLTRNFALTTFRYSGDVVMRTTERDVFSGQGTLLWYKPGSERTWRIYVQHLSRTPVILSDFPAQRR